MNIAVQEYAGTGFVEIDLSGKLTAEDYKSYIPEIEKLIQQHGRLRLLVRMHDFHGWTAGALCQDLKFDAKHFRHIERIAFVGDQKWEEGMSKFCKAFTTAEVRFFEPDRIEGAREWLRT